MTEYASLSDFLERSKAAVDTELQRILEGLADWPEATTVREAMTYSVFAGGGGKRLRPTLTFLSASLLGIPAEDVIGPAAAVELIHCYTLVIDDIQDADALRRGEPATYVKYGLNDSLLVSGRLFIEGLSRLQQTTAIAPDLIRDRLHFLHVGQEGDLASESWDDRLHSPEGLEFIFRGKTGSLFELAMLAGAGAHPLTTETHNTLRRMGSNLGYLFQAVDDLLEATETTEALGKPAGADRGNKVTFVKIFPDAARAKVAAVRAQIDRDLKTFGGDVPLFSAYLDMMETRRS